MSDCHFETVLDSGINSSDCCIFQLRKCSPLRCCNVLSDHVPKCVSASVPSVQLDGESLLDAGNRRHRDAGAAFMLRPAL